MERVWLGNLSVPWSSPSTKSDSTDHIGLKVAIYEGIVKPVIRIPGPYSSLGENQVQREARRWLLWLCGSATVPLPWRRHPASGLYRPPRVN